MTRRGLVKNYQYYHIERKEISRHLQNKKNITEVILKKDRTYHLSKKYRILADIFRNKLKRYIQASDIVSGLVNYRITKYYY